MSSLTEPGTLESWAALKPDEVCAVEADRYLTWRKREHQARALATGLRQAGLVRGDVVAVRTQIRLEWLIINAALAKLGCLMLATNWRLTPGEFRQVARDAGAKALFCDDKLPEPLVSAVSELSFHIIVGIDGMSPGMTAFESLLDTPPDDRLSVGGPVPLIIYTSGTSGAPKGVVLGQYTKHSSDSERQEYVTERDKHDAPREGERVLLTMPLHHGAGPAIVQSCLSRGVCLIMLRRYDAEATLQLIQEHGITRWNAVSTMLKRIAGLPEENLQRYDVSSLKAVTLGAGPSPFVLKDWAMKFFGELSVTERYGSTESGMVSRLAPEMQRVKPDSCGLPYPHVIVKVRDDHGRDLPTGEVGELWIRTPVSFQGYLNAPPLEPDQLDSQGLYRTGDMGYFDQDHYLYITDRAKDMIIAGGVNIYPAEIEAALMTHPAILDVAVFGIPDDDFGESVYAVCELKAGHITDQAAILSHAASVLASYKRPKNIAFVTELPRNSMSKILKRELRAPFWATKKRAI